MRLALCIFLFSKIVSAQMHYNVEGALRTDPRAMDLTGTAAYDQILRGEASKENPFYSYARLGATLGGSPTAAAFLDYAPIAPLIFSVQQSHTHRFQNIDRFDCNTYECQGDIERTDYSVRLVLGYEKFFFTQNYIWREIHSPQKTRPIYIEQENFVVAGGFQRFNEANSILGYMISDEQQAGLMYTSDELAEGHAKAHTASIFYRAQYHEYSVTVGLSDYKYAPFDIRGTGGFITLDWDYGPKLSLF